MNTPVSLPELARELRRSLRDGLPSRPFIADGSPFGCDVAIVGINPGTSTSFWDYWSDEYGFARDRWVSAYYSAPGAKRNATRNRIERLVPALRPLRVIELNAYPYATRTESEISAELKDPTVLHLMLRVAKPRALFLFGRVPAREVSALLGLPPLLAGTTSTCEYEGRSILVFTEPHLSRGWSYVAVDALADRLKRELQNAV